MCEDELRQSENYIIVHARTGKEVLESVIQQRLNVLSGIFGREIDVNTLKLFLMNDKFGTGQEILSKRFGWEPILTLTCEEFSKRRGQWMGENEKIVFYEWSHT